MGICMCTDLLISKALTGDHNSAWVELHLDIPCVAGILEVLVTHAGRAEGVRSDWHEASIRPLVQLSVAKIKGTDVRQRSALVPQKQET